MAGSFADQLGEEWSLSERQYDVIEERDVAIPVDGGDVTLYADVFRPDTSSPVPAVIGASPYNKEYQSQPVKPKSVGPQLAWVESGDPYYFARRGYAHVILNVRGTGKSDGRFSHLGPREVTDVIESMDWLAEQSWCSGEFGMFGVSYFASVAKYVAAEDPEKLDAIFAPWAFSDPYRDLMYQGGILGTFVIGWGDHLDDPEMYEWPRGPYSADDHEQLIEAVKQDPELYAHDEIVDAVEHPNKGTNAEIADIVLNKTCNEYWEERKLDYSETNTPAFLGGGWGAYGIHLPGAFRDWENWQGPKKLLIGPDRYLDRPLYQLQPKAVRWFDYWIKGKENGVMDEPEVKLFVMGADDWKTTDDWPVPDTTFTRFYLHEENLLFERDHWPNEGSTTYEDGPFRRESVEFFSPPLVEATEVVGPVRLDLFASTTDEEVLFFAELIDRAPDSTEEELTRGWLRGSQRQVEEAKSTPWRAHHPHDERKPLTPDEVYEFNVNIRATGSRFAPGHQIGLRISSADVGGGWHDVDESQMSWKQGIATGHVARQATSRITIHHNAEYPSNLLLPITGGNEMGTYYSGGEPTASFGQLPEREIQRPKAPDE